ncbi:MAG: hypothetical protein P1V35_12805 [Planctomycetota bacterium]|nr:hypothetical protein [Planctomycetota bacterium]
MKRTLPIAVSALCLSTILAAQPQQPETNVLSERGVSAERGPLMPSPAAELQKDATPTARPTRGRGILGPDRVLPIESQEATPNRAKTHWSTDRHGNHWARGADYKAGFTPRGMEFVPFLGSSASKSYPVQFTLESVRIGSEPLALTEKGKVSREGNQVEIDRGSTQVLYDLTAESVEQSFAFADLPQQGELVLHIALHTELQTEFRDNVVTFSNALGGLTYDHAIAIDGKGNRISLDILPSGSGLDLVVPASFVAAADGDLIVDPLIQTFSVDVLPGATLSDPDIAYSYTDNAYAAVYEEQFSGSDTDIYCRVIDGTTGSDLGLSRYIDSSNEVWQSPAIGFQFFYNNFIVVAESQNLGETEGNIRARTFTSSVLGVSPIIDVALHGSSFDCKAPDIGGNVNQPFYSIVCVVWERDFGTDRDIGYATLNGDGTIDQPAAVLRTSASFDFGEPAISKTTGQQNFGSHWAVAWSRDPVGTGASAVEVRRIDRTGAPLGTEFLAAASSTQNFREVAVSTPLVDEDPTGNRYFLVAAERSPNVLNDHVVVLCAGDATTDSIILEETIHEDLSRDQDAIQFAATAYSWITVFTRHSSALEWNNYACALRVVGHELAVSEVPYLVDSMTHGIPGQIPLPLAVASAVSGGAPGTNERAALVWPTELATGDSSIRGALMEADTTRIAGYQYCYGAINSTGKGAFIIAHGTPWTMDPINLTAVRMPLYQFGYFLSGSGFGHIPNPGGSDGSLCLGGGIGRYNLASEIGYTGDTGTLELTIDPTQIRQPMGPVSAIVGQTWRFQAWFRDTAAGVGNSNFSNGVAVTFE